MEAASERFDDRSSAILIYTDGACDPNPGRGGWGVRVVHPNGNLARSEGERARVDNQ
jgi:ribonuclease HI